MDEPLPVQIDRALEQTRAAGHVYAAVPLPWFEEWARYVADRSASNFRWPDTCWGATYVLGNGTFVQVDDIDGNGNVVICLRAPEHVGKCALG